MIDNVLFTIHVYLLKKNILIFDCKMIFRHTPWW